MLDGPPHDAPPQRRRDRLPGDCLRRVLDPFTPPGSSGVICLGTNIGRYNGNVGQGPSFSLQVDLTAMPVNPPVAVQPGDSWNFQCWYRDIGNTNNFTDAVSVTFN